MQFVKPYTLVLASQSPRRKELLGWLDIPFLIRAADLAEESDYADPLAICKDIAQQKGRAVMDELKNEKNFLVDFFPFVVSSDTIVTLDGVLFGKPKDALQASEMLMALSGKTHRVITAVHMASIDCSGILRQHTFACQTDVTFSAISMDILKNYIESGDSFDKAGAYGIQGKGLTFVSAVNGSYSNVVGFPLSDFIEEMKGFLGMKDDRAGSWRDAFIKQL